MALDEQVKALDREAAVRLVMAEMSALDEGEARFIVALIRGETDGDVIYEGSMTEERRQRLGIGLPIDTSLRRFEEAEGTGEASGGPQAAR